MLPCAARHGAHTGSKVAGLAAQCVQSPDCHTWRGGQGCSGLTTGGGRWLGDGQSPRPGGRPRGPRHPLKRPPHVPPATATSVELCAVTVALRWGAGTSVGDTPKPRGGGPAVPPRGDLVLPAAELQWGRGRGDWQAVCGPRVGGGAREGARTHSGAAPLALGGADGISPKVSAFLALRMATDFEFLGMRP